MAKKEEDTKKKQKTSPKKKESSVKNGVNNNNSKKEQPQNKKTKQKSTAKENSNKKNQSSDNKKKDENKSNKKEVKSVNKKEEDPKQKPKTENKEKDIEKQDTKKEKKDNKKATDKKEEKKKDEDTQVEEKKSESKTEEKKQKKQDKKNEDKQKEDDKKEDNKVDKDKAKPKHAAKEHVKTNKEIRMERLEKRRRWKKRKKIAIRIAACVAAVYAVGVVFFALVSFPKTVVADTDLSFHTPYFMKQALIPNSGEYVFTAEGYDFELQIDGELIEYNFDVDQVVDKIVEYKNPFKWPVEIFKVHDFMSESVVSYNKEMATSLAVPAIKAHNGQATQPQNADFICDTTTKNVTVKQEVIGNTLNEEKTLTSILGYIGSGRRNLELGDEEHLVPTLYADDDKIPSAIEGANKLLMSVMALQMSTTNVANIDFQLLSTWIKLKEGYIAGLNDDLVAVWVAQLANQCNTVGKTRTYTTPYGKTCSVSGGDAIGWEIDQPGLVEAINNQAPQGVSANIQVPCVSSLNGYAGPGNRDWGARYIDVDLSQQHARMYNDAGALVWEADIVSGKPSTPTPTGIYTIKSKASPSTLRGVPDPITGQPSYISHVQYWMGFVGNLIGFHDATWQSAFGGNRYLTYGSHGCVNLSYGSAQSLYGICASGDVVVVHN